MGDIENNRIEQTPFFRERLREEGRELLSSRFWYVLAVGSFLYLVFYGLDFVLAPEHRLIFLGIRLFVVFNHVAGIALLSSKHGPRIAAPLSVWAAYISSLAIAVMSVFLGGFASSYYVGIVFVLFMTGLFVPWTAAVTVLNGLLTVVSYFAVNIIFGPPESMSLAVAASPFFFLSGAVVLTAAANYGKELTRRRDLRLRIQIEKANEELKELDNAKTRFFSNVSHELRTPLTLILGPLEILKGKGNPDLQPLLESMESNARRLLRHVNELLDFAKIDAGKLDCSYEYGNLGRILQGLTTAAGPHLMNRKIGLTSHGLDNMPDSILDSGKVETMAANLLSNAIKFTPDGGKITITAGESGESIWFEIEDTGIGIPDERLDTIFERFHQVDDALSRNREGTGLGLAMVKQLARLHNGKVTVESKLGAGSKFRIELPQRPDFKSLERRGMIGRRREDQISYARTAALISSAGEMKSGSQAFTLLADVAGHRFNSPQDRSDEITDKKDAQKILVVDDNQELRSFIGGSLSEDYSVETANDGLEGLDAARRRAPDLIISDIMMPRMDGYEFTRQIRQDPSLSQIPVILVTAKAGGEAVEEGLDVGANDYLAKPFEIRELKARVSSQLRTRRLERNLNERESRLAAIGQMTSVIVHDLKNPISAIIGFAQIVRQDLQTGRGAETAARDLEPVISEANRLSRMIAEVLDFARGGSSDLNMVPIELATYLESVCQPLKQKMNAMGIELELIRQSGVNPIVNIDNDRMLRVIENLVRNSQEAIWSVGNKPPPGKKIRITISADQRSASVTISDNGPGIPKEMLSKLFDPFSSGKKRSGTGLGLATVRNLVLAHGGEITVEPKGVDGGATFLMKFPRISGNRA